MVQVRIIKVNGRNKAAWRPKMVSGAWGQWHHMTVSDAREALKAGRFDFLVGQYVDVIPC